jgi:hypothetical protein
MVSVAKSFDAPIKVSKNASKVHTIPNWFWFVLSQFFSNLIVTYFFQLLFPTGDALRPYSMLGLGDIVIPGMFSNA